MTQEWLVIAVLDRTCNQKGYLKRLTRNEEYQYAYELNESIREAIFYDVAEHGDANSVLNLHLDLLSSEFNDLDFQVQTVSVKPN